MKVESQVIVNHHVTVNMYLYLAHTARHMLEAIMVRNLKKLNQIFIRQIKIYRTFGLKFIKLFS